jgi:hypothetical protein
MEYGILIKNPVFEEGEFYKKIMNLLIACAFSLIIFTGCNATNSDNNTSNNTNSTPAVNTI